MMIWMIGNYSVEAVMVIDYSIKCLEARDGVEGLEVLNGLTVLADWIFIDRNMPRMDGKSCLAEIRKTPDYNEIPIVVYSTSAQPQEISDYKRFKISSRGIVSSN
jgi:CheY-like chemotaxis protein